jgi:hypothetical protein
MTKLRVRRGEELPTRSRVLRRYTVSFVAEGDDAPDSEPEGAGSDPQSVAVGSGDSDSAAGSTADTDEG